MSAVFSTESRFYPYGKVMPSYYDLSQLPHLSKKVCDYLLDAPNPNAGYITPDNNEYPRCRFWKYLYHDNANPLSQSLPTIEQKMSVLFDPKSPENPPTDKGYRLIPQIFTKPAKTEAQTMVYFYIGRAFPSSDEYKVCLAVNFIIWTHYQYEANMQSDVLSRISGIEQALIEAFHGVNMDGIGTFFFSRSKHPDCGSEEFTDGNTTIGRRLTIALEIATTTTAVNTADSLPQYDNGLRVGFLC